MDQDVRRAEAAKYILIDRNARYRLFPSELFDEHAWNMLLYLFIAFANKQIMSERLLIAAIKSPTHIGQHYLYELAKNGQVEPRISGDDVMLSAPTLAKLRDYLDTVHVSRNS